MQSQPTSEERERFTEAVKAHSSAMFRCARTLLGSDADAEDAVSEAVLKAWQAWGNLRKPKAVKTWLLKITVNCAYEQLRKNCRMLYTEDLTPYEQAEKAQEPVYDLCARWNGWRNTRERWLCCFIMKNVRSGKLRRCWRFPKVQLNPACPERVRSSSRC